jgi:hypothetical protein
MALDTDLLCVAIGDAPMLVVDGSDKPASSIGYNPPDRYFDWRWLMGEDMLAGG